MKSVAELEREITKRLKDKEGQAVGKTPEQIEKEILENREAMEAIELKAAKEPAKKELVSDLEINITKPVIPSLMDCPFCGEQKSIKGMNRHIAAKHEILGVIIQDLDRVKRGEITPDALATEKGAETVVNLSPEVSKKHFSDWEDIEDSLEDPEEEDPEEKEDPEETREEEDPRDPESLEDPEDLGPKENGASMALPLIFIIGIPAVLILSRIPKFKEISDKLLAILGDLGSKKSSDSTKTPSINFSSWPHRRF